MFDTSPTHVNFSIGSWKIGIFASESIPQGYKTNFLYYRDIFATLTYHVAWGAFKPIYRKSEWCLWSGPSNQEADCILYSHSVPLSLFKYQTRFCLFLVGKSDNIRRRRTMLFTVYKRGLSLWLNFSRRNKGKSCLKISMCFDGVFLIANNQFLTAWKKPQEPYRVKQLITTTKLLLWESNRLLPAQFL